MAVTLVEAGKLSNDTLHTGVFETITKDGPLLQLLPFMVVLGNALTYNRENVAATAAFRSVGAAWTEDTPTLTQVTATLKIIGGDADVDNFLRATRGNLQDLDAEIITLKALAVRRLLEDTFINGDEGVNPDAFDGIDLLTPTAQTVTNGANGGALTLALLDELIDKIRGGAPDMLLMSRRSRRQINVLARASGTFLETDILQFGTWVQRYNGIPIVINDYISDAQVVGTSGDASTIHAVRLGPDALMGIAAGQGDDDPNGIIQVENIGSLEAKDATRWRIKGYISLALFRTDAIARLQGLRA